MVEIDALDKLRGRIYEDLKLLEDARAANARGKSHVVEDHLDRVISSLQKGLGTGVDR